MAKHLESCVDEIARFRANMTMLREAILADHGELSELENSRPGRDHADHQVHEDRINAIKRRLADRHVLWARVVPELEALLAQCRESEARAPAREEDRTALQDSLRKAIDDPRYWRDGDPGLARFVSDGFRRLYRGD